MQARDRTALLAVAAAIALASCAVDEPTPTVSAPPVSRLEVLPMTEPNSRIIIDAVAGDDVWGTIAVQRGEDTGGYPTSSVDPGTFIIEILVQYTADAATEARFGARDWGLVTASDRREVGGIFVPDPPQVPWEVWERPALPQEMTTDQIAVEPMEVTGWLLFQVPRDLAGAPLELVYRPEGSAEAITAFAVRNAGPPPGPVPTATPEPRPPVLVYEEPSGAPFSVIADAEADDLFTDADTCTNPVAGYTLDYPDDWYTNTAIGLTPACSWFSPTTFEVEGAEVPPEIAIEITSFVGGYGFVHEPDYSIHEAITVDGWSAGRSEEVGGFGADGFLPRSLFTYQYVIQASDDSDGLHVVAATANDHAGSYERHKAVLDRIMASLRFDTARSE